MTGKVREVSPHGSGSLFVISAPSGAGKTSLVHALLERKPGIALSISTTTREPRPGEENGREYNFTTVEKFKAAEKQGEFLETALVHGNYYGTSKTWVKKQLASGIDVLLEIDWQGAEQVMKIFPETVSVFILPPSMQALNERLHKRGQDSEETITKRLQGASAEMIHANLFEFVIINDDFDTALDQLCAVVSIARLRFSKQAATHKDVFKQLGVPS